MKHKQNWFNRKYSDVKNFTSDFFYGIGVGADSLRYPIHKFRRGVDYIDQAIEHGSKIPLLNDTLSLIADNPLYVETLGLIHSSDKTLGDVANIGYDLQKAIGVSPFYQEQTHTYSPSYKPVWDTPRVSFDAGFVPARKDIARIRGEPQIEGAIDPSKEFQGVTTPSQYSSSNTGGDIPISHNVPAEAQPGDLLDYKSYSGKLDVGYASEFQPAPVASSSVPLRTQAVS